MHVTLNLFFLPFHSYVISMLYKVSVTANYFIRVDDI